MSGQLPEIPAGEFLPTGYEIVVGVLSGFSRDPLRSAESLYLAWHVSFEAVAHGESVLYADRLRSACVFALENFVLPRLQTQAPDPGMPELQAIYAEMARIAAETVDEWRKYIKTALPHAEGRPSPPSPTAN